MSRPDAVQPKGPIELALKLDNVTKLYSGGSITAIEEFSLEVMRGEFLCIVGGSGCGKSTLLHIAAGLEAPTSGRVEVTAPRRALLFQDGALFPWLTVERNIELALKLRGMARAERKQQTQKLLDMVHLSAFASKRPHELSGGMRQRVAIARAIAQDAEILLLDEPFASLDAMTRDALHDELERLWTENGFTVVLVTHNVREAVRLGDRVVLITSRPGKIADEFEVPFPRPRRIESHEVSGLARYITDRLHEEGRKLPSTDAITT